MKNIVRNPAAIPHSNLIPIRNKDIRSRVILSRDTRNRAAISLDTKVAIITIHKPHQRSQR